MMQTKVEQILLPLEHPLRDVAIIYLKRLGIFTLIVLINLILLEGVWGGLFVIMLAIWASAGYAYRVNAKKPDGDPQKRDFHPAAIFLAPITWPLLLFGYISIFIIKILVYGLFLILLTIALVAIRKPFLLIGLNKVAIYIGNYLYKLGIKLPKVPVREDTELPNMVSKLINIQTRIMNRLLEVNIFLRELAFGTLKPRTI